MTKKNVVIGFMGTQLDSGQGAGRWSKWRPTVSLVQHEDRLIDRIELLYSKKYQSLADVLVKDIANVSPETQVNLVTAEVADPFGEDLEVYRRTRDELTALTTVVAVRLAEDRRNARG